jgi:hypothetical protein
MRRQNDLDWMAASITRIYSPLNILLNQIQHRFIYSDTKFKVLVPKVH